MHFTRTSSVLLTSLFLFSTSPSPAKNPNPTKYVVPPKLKARLSENKTLRMPIRELRARANEHRKDVVGMRPPGVLDQYPDLTDDDKTFIQQAVLNTYNLTDDTETVPPMPELTDVQKSAYDDIHASLEAAINGPITIGGPVEVPVSDVGADQVTTHVIGGNKSTAYAPAIDVLNTLGRGCSAVVAGSKYIHLAGHCVYDPIFDSKNSPWNNFTVGFRPGNQILLMRPGNKTQWVKIAGIATAPNWWNSPTAIPSASFPDSGVDVALIALQTSVSPNLVTANLYGRLVTRAPLPENNWGVIMTGYGCQTSYNLAFQQDHQFKAAPTVTVPTYLLLNASAPFLFPGYPGAQAAYFFTIVSQRYALTPGQRGGGVASLCPGDSGGPLFLGNGTQIDVVGVNAYYGFVDGSGKSYVNMFTRLTSQGYGWDTAAWLESFPGLNIYH